MQILETALRTCKRPATICSGRRSIDQGRFINLTIAVVVFAIANLIGWSDTTLAY
jgi:hypothetical protein